MFGVEVTYSGDKWKDYFKSKPLTFAEFVDKASNREAIYEHIIETTRQEIHSEVHIQGCLGCGKSVFINMLVLYRVYLFMLLKNPSEYFGHTEGTKYFIGVFGGKFKNKFFFRESLLNTIDNFPDFFEIIGEGSLGSDTSKISVDTSENLNVVFNFGGNMLTMESIIQPSDLVGRNYIIGVFSELESCKEYYGLEDSDIMKMYLCMLHRIQARVSGESLIHLCILEKSPESYFNDIDQYICRSESEKDYSCNITVIRYLYIWLLKNREYYRKNYKWGYFNNLLEIFVPEDRKNDVSVIPVPILINDINDPKEIYRFRTDFIGLPSGKSKMDKLYCVRETMRNNDITVGVDKGRIVLIDKKSQLTLRLEDEI